MKARTQTNPILTMLIGFLQCLSHWGSPQPSPRPLCSLLLVSPPNATIHRAAANDIDFGNLAARSFDATPWVRPARA